MGILEKLGIDPLHLIAQLINFAIILVVLRIFLYKPIKKIFATRREKIEEGLTQASIAEKKAIENEKENKKKMELVKKESENMMKETKKENERIRQKMLAEAKDESQKYLDKARKEIALEREQLIEDAKKKVGELSIEVAQKILQREINPANQKQLVDESIEKIK